MILDEMTNGSFCTADLWRIAQNSRSAYLAFWLRSLFRKRLTYGLKRSEQGAPLGVVLAFPPRKPEVSASITEPRPRSLETKRAMSRLALSVVRLAPTFW
jgi:hypothetical protein